MLYLLVDCWGVKCATVLFACSHGDQNLHPCRRIKVTDYQTAGNFSSQDAEEKSAARAKRLISCTKKRRLFLLFLAFLLIRRLIRTKTLTSESGSE